MPSSCTEAATDMDRSVYCSRNSTSSKRPWRVGDKYTVTGIPVMSKSKRDFSYRLAKALDQAAVRIIQAPEMSPEQIISVFDEIESEFLLKISGNPTLVIETRRRIAEYKLTEYMTRNVPYEATVALLENLYDLGFSSLAMRANYEIIFSKYCKRQMRYDKAREMLLNLDRELEKALRKKNSVVYRELRQKVGALLRSLNGHSD